MNRIKQLKTSDYDEIFELSQFAFQYKLSKEDMRKKKKEAERHIIWGYMDNEKIAAKLHLIPLTTYINGKEFEMGGISSVATWPEYRRQGMAKQLMYHALKYMKKEGYTITFLHPFSFAFYRQYGFEHTFSLKRYTIPSEKMSGRWQGNGYVRRSGFDIPLLNSIYTDYAKQYTGTINRDEKWWKERSFKQVEQIAVAYNENNKPEGYIHYNVKNNELVVKELAYRTVNGWQLLLEFIANHDSMVETIKMTVPESDHLTEFAHEPDFKQHIEPYFMARVVDVKSFLSDYPFVEAVTDNESVVLLVDDPFLPENKGMYRLTQRNAKVSVVQEEYKSVSESAIVCTIHQLTMIVLGYKRPLELYHLGLIGGCENEINRFERWIPVQKTYYPLSDFF
ncbi:MAG TPA: GNAT family N-acetyltransferase [Pseudogracilibacillus sp.]|nr:GNAT family N-acetyltransferase [Pseudogracilibacillus sp.]